MLPEVTAEQRSGQDTDSSNAPEAGSLGISKDGQPQGLPAADGNEELGGRISEDVVDEREYSSEQEGKGQEPGRASISIAAWASDHEQPATGGTDSGEVADSEEASDSGKVADSREVAYSGEVADSREAADVQAEVAAVVSESSSSDWPVKGANFVREALPDGCCLLL
jgi:hypothetical protein